MIMASINESIVPFDLSPISTLQTLLGIMETVDYIERMTSLADAIWMPCSNYLL